MKNFIHNLKTLPIIAFILLSTLLYGQPAPARSELCQPEQRCITSDELKVLEEQALAVRLLVLDICDFIRPSEESLCKTTGSIFKRKRVCKEPHTATMQEVADLVNTKLHPAIKAMHATYDNKTFTTAGSGKRTQRKQVAWAEIVKEMKKIDEFVEHADKVLSQPEHKLTLVEISLDCHQIGWSTLFIMDDAYKVRTGKDPFSYGHWWWVPEFPSAIAMPKN